MKLRNHSYEKILLDEKGDKIKTIENSGIILPLDDLSIPDLDINFAQYHPSKIRDQMQSLIGSLKFNLKSIDEELYPLLKILKKKIIRALDKVEKNPFDDFFVVLNFDI